MFWIIRETAHIRKLARKVIDQRTEVEQFFIDALGYVKREIVTNRFAYIYMHTLILHRYFILMY